MNIGIVGLGYVGKAVQASYLSASHNVQYYDPHILGSVESLTELVSTNPKAIFICVPTPANDDGSCDTSIVKESLDTLLQTYTGTIIVKSTTQPNFWKQYTKYSNVFHVPEFLTANNALHDYINPKFVIIGGHSSEAHNVTNVLLGSSVDMNVPIYYTDLITAGLVKYFMNTFLATKVTLLNQYFKLAEAIGADWHGFTKMIQLDERMGTSHNNVPGPDGQFGYGGACFPKDVCAIIDTLKLNNVSLGILEAVHSANNQIRK